MKQPPPVLVSDLFAPLLDALLGLLSGLSAREWNAPTACASWSVRDVALHLLGGDIGVLSRRRDGFMPPGPAPGNWEELVDLIDHLNESWLQAARRISPRLLVDLLGYTGAQVDRYFQTLDPHAPGNPVSWAGPDPAPVWLDLAREYTERWHHQQHIRDALGRPGLKEPEFLAPVLATFVRALPRTYEGIDAPDGTLVALTITGDAGGRWFLLREDGAWRLYVDVSQSPHAEVRMDDEIAWRLFTRELGREEVRARATIVGDRSLGQTLLETVSIIAR